MISLLKWVGSGILSFFKGLGVTGTLIVLSCLASASLVGYSMWSAGKARKSLEASQAALKSVTDDRDRLSANAKANEAAGKARQAYREAISNKEAIGRARTEQALQNNSDWANQPVPSDVLDSLRDDPSAGDTN